MTPRPIFPPSSVCPVPPEFDVEARIETLEGMIADPNTKEDQKPNLQQAIDLYKKGELPTYGRLVLFQDGKVITLQQLHPRSSWWAEGILRQHAQKLIDVDDSSKDPEKSEKSENFHQLAHRVAYPFDPLRSGHLIFARMRLIPGFGSPSNPMNITMLNDTGSDMQTVFPADLTTLGVTPNYTGYGPAVTLETAGGQVVRNTITFEIQLLTAQGTIASPWMPENGVINPDVGASRLSGSGIRNALYFATPPGNQNLYVSEKKNGIVQQLPTV